MREIFGSTPFRSFSITPIEHVQRQHPLRNLLAFAGRSIDEVVNCPIAKREVILFHRLGRSIRRLAEADDLERQWDPNRTLSRPQSINSR